MNEKVRKFIDINRDNIKSVYLFTCSSGESAVYIFTKKQGCKDLNLLTEARYTDDVISYPLPMEFEQALKECVGDGIAV